METKIYSIINKNRQSAKDSENIGMFVSKSISFAKAAQLSGMGLSEFMDLLRTVNIPAVDYTEKMLDDDLEFIKEYESENKEI